MMKAVVGFSGLTLIVYNSVDIISIFGVLVPY